MATTQEAIRRLSIQATVSGVDAATGQLEKLAGAQNDVAVASANTEKATLSLDGKFASIERRYVAQVRAQQDYEKVQRQVNAAVAQNPALQDRANTVLTAAKQKLDQVTGGANDNAKAVGLQRYELINLGRQAQDVFVSLASGQNLWTVGIQQGTQALDIFSSSTGTVSGFFKQAGSWLTGFLTAGRIAFGGVTALIVGSVAALNSYLAAQQKVNFSLLGSGRASGATAGSINSIAQQGSSTFGLSVSEARELASTLASTGKIANDNILPIVKMGHDIAVAFGTDAAGATKLLSDAFADPVKGADDLNQRLGFLDASTKRNIQNLVAQNNLYAAQKALLAGLQTGLDGMNTAVSTSANFWTALGNKASNAWDAIGRGLSRVTGIGLTVGLDEQVTAAKNQLAIAQAALKQAQEYDNYRKTAGVSDLFGGAAAASGEVDRLNAKISDLTAKLKGYAQATEEAQARQRSFAQDAAMRMELPQVGQLEELQNRSVTLQTAIEDTQKAIANLVPDEATGSRLGILTKALELFQQALGKSQTAIKNFKTDYDIALEQQSFQSQAITAFSPAAKGQVAYNEAYANGLRQYNDATKAAAVAEGARAIAIKQSTVALSEQARAQELSARQAVASQQLEIDLIGKTIGQQAELRANLQARQQLEQQASQNRTAFDNAEYERLQKINAELGKRAQAAAQAAVNDNISFGRQTALLSPDDVQIAQQLKGLYPDVAQGLASVQAQGLRTNQALSGLASSISGNLVTGFADAIDGTKSFGQAMADTGKLVVRAIEEMIIKVLIIGPLLRNLQNAFSGSGILSFLGGSGGGTGLSLTGTGGLYASGGYTGPGGKYDPAGIVHRGEYVMDASTTSRIGVGNLDRLRGYASGGYVDDNVFSPKSWRGAPQDNSPTIVNVNVENTAGADVSVTKQRNSSGGVDVKVLVKQAVNDGIANGDFDKTMRARYGAGPVTGRR